jgi:hypothetical protein
VDEVADEHGPRRHRHASVDFGVAPDELVGDIHAALAGEVAAEHSGAKVRHASVDFHFAPHDLAEAIHAELAEEIAEEHAVGGVGVAGIKIAPPTAAASTAASTAPAGVESAFQQPTAEGASVEAIKAVYERMASMPKYGNATFVAGHDGGPSIVAGGSQQDVPARCSSFLTHRFGSRWDGGSRVHLHHTSQG